MHVFIKQYTFGLDRPIGSAATPLKDIGIGIKLIIPYL